MQYWKNKSLLKLSDHSASAVNELLNLAAELKAAKKEGREIQYLQGKNIALIFEKTSTRTRCAFEVACYDQGANCTYIGPGSSQFGDKESVADTARVLGRLYDAIEYRGFGQTIVETLSKYSGKPVYNGLTNEFHPTQMLADLLTMQEFSPKPLTQTCFAYLGDGRNNTGNSLLLSGALMGMDVRIVAPAALQPTSLIIERALALSRHSGAVITITDDITQGVKGADFIYTDVWVSMGENQEIWEKRTNLLLPYRVTRELLAATGNQAVKFMHCLPAYHDRATPMGDWFYQHHHVAGIEVSHEVFESKDAIVFTQAENRMHTIKALLVATLAR